MGCASARLGGGGRRGDLRVRSGEQSDGVRAWISRWALFCVWFRGSACCRGGRSYVRAPRYFRNTTSRATSLAHVLRLVHRFSVHIPGTATSIPLFFSHDRLTFFPDCPASDVDDFLGGPDSLHKCTQEKVAAEQGRGLLVADVGLEHGEMKPSRWRPQPCRFMEEHPPVWWVAIEGFS